MSRLILFKNNIVKFFKAIYKYLPMFLPFLIPFINLFIIDYKKAFNDDYIFDRAMIWFSYTYNMCMLIFILGL